MPTASEWRSVWFSTPGEITMSTNGTAEPSHAAASLGCSSSDGTFESGLAATGGHFSGRRLLSLLASDAAAMVTGAEYEVTGGDSAKDI